MNYDRVQSLMLLFGMWFYGRNGMQVAMSDRPSAEKELDVWVAESNWSVTREECDEMMMEFGL